MCCSKTLSPIKHVCMYVCTYVCMYVYIYIYIYVHSVCLPVSMLGSGGFWDRLRPPTPIPDARALAHLRQDPDRVVPILLEIGARDEKLIPALHRSSLTA